MKIRRTKMSKFKDILIEAEEQLRDEYYEEHPNATPKELDDNVTYDMVYERAQDNINAIGDYKADLIMGK